MASICTKFIPQFFKWCENFRDKSLTFSNTLEAQSLNVASVLPGVKIHNCKLHTWISLILVCQWGLGFIMISFSLYFVCFALPGRLRGEFTRKAVLSDVFQSLPSSFVRSYRVKRDQLTKNSLSVLNLSVTRPRMHFLHSDFSRGKFPHHSS